MQATLSSADLRAIPVARWPFALNDWAESSVGARGSKTVRYQNKSRVLDLLDSPPTIDVDAFLDQWPSARPLRTQTTSDRVPSDTLRVLAAIDGAAAAICAATYSSSKVARFVAAPLDCDAHAFVLESSSAPGIVFVRYNHLMRAREREPLDSTDGDFDAPDEFAIESVSLQCSLVQLFQSSDAALRDVARVRVVTWSAHALTDDEPARVSTQVIVANGLQGAKRAQTPETYYALIVALDRAGQFATGVAPDESAERIGGEYDALVARALEKRLWRASALYFDLYRRLGKQKSDARRARQRSMLELGERMRFAFRRQLAALEDAFQRRSAASDAPLDTLVERVVDALLGAARRHAYSVATPETDNELPYSTIIGIADQWVACARKSLAAALSQIKRNAMQRQRQSSPLQLAAPLYSSGSESSSGESDRFALPTLESDDLSASDSASDGESRSPATQDSKRRRTGARHRAQKDAIVVRVQSKTPEHPLASKGSRRAFVVVRGANKPLFGEPLVLRADRAYEFLIDAPGHPLYIGTDMKGGGARTQRTQVIPVPPAAPVASGTFLLPRQSVAALVGDTLYVACARHEYMGFAVQFKD